MKRVEGSLIGMNNFLFIAFRIFNFQIHQSYFRYKANRRATLPQFLLLRLELHYTIAPLLIILNLKKKGDQKFHALSTKTRRPLDKIHQLN
jgi:hypothetical protein